MSDCGQPRKAATLHEMTIRAKVDEAVARTEKIPEGTPNTPKNNKQPVCLVFKVLEKSQKTPLSLDDNRVPPTSTSRHQMSQRIAAHFWTAITVFSVVNRVHHASLHPSPSTRKAKAWFAVPRRVRWPRWRGAARSWCGRLKCAGDLLSNSVVLVHARALVKCPQKR